MRPIPGHAHMASRAGRLIRGEGKDPLLHRVATEGPLRFARHCGPHRQGQSERGAQLWPGVARQESAVADATLLVGFYMMTARFLETLAVEFDEVA